MALLFQSDDNDNDNADADADAVRTPVGARDVVRSRAFESESPSAHGYPRNQTEGSVEILLPAATWRLRGAGDCHHDAF